jgi:hypothetical protein
MENPMLQNMSNTHFTCIRIIWSINSPHPSIHPSPTLLHCQNSTAPPWLLPSPKLQVQKQITHV